MKRTDALVPSRRGNTARIAAGVLLVVVGLSLAAPQILLLRAAAEDGVRFGLLVLAGVVQIALSATWFLYDRAAELWILAARAWPLLLAAAGLRLLWSTLRGARARRDGEVSGSAS